MGGGPEPFWPSQAGRPHNPIGIAAITAPDPLFTGVTQICGGAGEFLMLLYALANQIRLRDGTFAVRSADYPECEGRSPQGWAAREEFRLSLGDRVPQMIEEGNVPILYRSLDEIAPIFKSHCRKQMPAPDRLPNTFDLGVIEEVSLSDDVATRFASMVSAQIRQERPVSTAGQTDAPPLLPDAVQSLADVLSPPMDEEQNADQSQWSGVSATKVDISPRSQPIPLPPEADAQAAAPELRIRSGRVLNPFLILARCWPRWR